MIDTIKIYTMIDNSLYNHLYNNSTIKTSYDKSTGQVFYEIVNNSLEGSYSSSLSIRIGNGNKYKFFDNYYIEIEGSYHKFIKGYNSHNGFYNLNLIVSNLINIVETNYNIQLPTLNHWFLQRIDIALCYNLESQDKVQTYIDNLSSCTFPKRKIKHYESESIYISGNTTTLKIYNKQKEFLKHDIRKLQNTDFNVYNYLNEIAGFIRFECEIKKAKLKYIYKEQHIRVNSLSYKELENICKKEFSILFKNIETDLQKVYKKEDVKKRLNSLFKPVRATNLFKFFLIIKSEGLQEIKKITGKSMYYKNISDLKHANIDFSQTMDNDYNIRDIDFNPFTHQEIL